MAYIKCPNCYALSNWPLDQCARDAFQIETEHPCLKCGATFLVIRKTGEYGDYLESREFPPGYIAKHPSPIMSKYLV